MGYTQHYKKEKCKAVKDVDFTKFETAAKVKVPPQIKVTFTKKVGTPANPFDVSIEMDGDNGKCRIVIKKLADGDATIDWTDMAIRGLDVAVTKIKQEVSSWQHIAEDYHGALADAVSKLKTQKEQIKALESNLADPQIVAKIAVIQNAVQKAAADGKAVYEKFNSWYVSGPRQGIAPVMVAQKVDPSKVAKNDADLFNTVVMDISQQSNVVQKAFLIEIKDAAKALLARLENLHAQVTKSAGEALADVRARTAKAIQELQANGARSASAMKLESVVQQAEDFKARKGQAFDRIKDHPNFIVAAIEANNTRSKGADSSLAGVEKSASRIRSSIPAAFQRDPAIMKLNQELIVIENGLVKTFTEGKHTLADANQHLDAYLKSHAPGRPGGSPQAANAPGTGQ